MYLEQSYDLAGMSVPTHCVVWEEIEECHGNGSIKYSKGMQQSLNSCKHNGVTVGLLRKDQQYDGMDVMKLYDKSAFPVSLYCEMLKAGIETCEKEEYKRHDEKY